MAELDKKVPQRSPEPDSRRGFLKLGMGVFGVGMAATVLGPAAALVAYPLGHETTSGTDSFLPVGRPTMFKGDDPMKIDLYSDKLDAWNRVIQVKVGSAWVVQQKGLLVAFSTVCPHLGCGIDFDTEKHKFLCACHKTWFSLDGGVEEGPSPRGMDALELKFEEKLVSIRYQRFKHGIAEKEPIA